MKIKVLAAFLIAVTLNSCHKKELPPDEDDIAPVFYLKCEIDGVPVNIDAGVNAYYMKSSYYQDSNNVYVFKGELKQKDCKANCGFGLTILLNDYKVSSNGTMNIDSTLSLASYQFNDGSLEPLFYSANFSPRQVNQNATYQWSFNDGSTWNSLNCTKMVKTSTTYSCTMQTVSQSYGNISHTNVFKIGNPVQTGVTATRVSPFTLYAFKFNAVNTTGVPPFSYLWDFGDGFTSDQANPNHEYTVSNYYTAKLTVTDANDNQCESYYQVPAVDGLYGEANYNASFAPIQNSKALSAITVLVNDPSGAVYSSGLTNQTDSSRFEIVSIENYKAPESSQLLKKIKIRFNCTAKSGANSIGIQNGEAVIAVAYKN